MPIDVILGLDPALRTFGYAVARILDGRIIPIAMGVVLTKPVPGANKSQDNLRAARELCRALMTLEERCGPFAEIRAEAMSYPPGAGSAARISLCWGAIAYYVELHGIPVYQASPQAIKKAIVGRIDASKDEVRAALARHFGGAFLGSLLMGVRPRMQEHPCDALAAVVALEGAEDRSSVDQARHGRRRTRAK